MKAPLQMVCVAIGEGLVHIHHTDVQRSGVDMGGAMRFETGNLGWVSEQLRRCRDDHRFVPVEHSAGGDNLKVSQGGPEQAPVMILRNRRAVPLPYAGVYVLAFPADILAQLLAGLRELH